MVKRLIKCNGFTLTELLVTISIFSILLAVTIPSFLAYRPTMRLKGAARDITSALQWARMKAVQENNTFAVQFNSADNSYSIFDDNDNDGVYAPADPVDMAVKASTLPQGISFGVGTSVNKDVNGNPPAPVDFITFTSPADICRLNQRGTANAGAIYLKNTKNESYSVTVSTGGKITIRKWNGSSWVE